MSIARRESLLNWPIIALLHTIATLTHPAHETNMIFT